MIHQLTCQTSPALRGLISVETRTPDNQCGVGISLEDDEEREALLAELEMHFAAQRFSNNAAAFEPVKTYALERTSRKPQSKRRIRKGAKRQWQRKKRRPF